MSPHKVKLWMVFFLFISELSPSYSLSSVKECMWHVVLFSFFFLSPHWNLLANVSRSQLSHIEHSEWHCHKIIELEIVDPHSVALWRKCYLFILDLSSSPSLNHAAKLGLWCFSIVSTPAFRLQMNSSEGLFFTANHSLLESNKYSKSHLLALYRRRK